jgi:ribonuclease HI
MNDQEINKKVNHFVIPISDEKRRIKELKYQLYIKGSAIDHKGFWNIIILNNKNEKILLNGTSNNATCDRMELYGLTEGIKYILQQHPEEEQKYVKINCYTESIYCLNIIKEWIQIWKKERFINRPNGDLLIDCSQNIDKCNFTINYIILSTHPIGQQL